MFYSSEIIKRVKQSNNIVSVISEYVTLIQKKNHYIGICPFHHETTLSFIVNPNTQTYFCYSCGSSGDVITFIMNYKKCSFSKAVKFLADRTNIALPELEDENNDTEEEHKKQLLKINQDATTYFCHQLRLPQGKSGYDYCTERKLSDKTIEQFQLGFSNHKINDLYLYLKAKGYSDSLIYDAGLIYINEQNQILDKFWNRIMFPIQDINHHIIGFGGRMITDGKPKYLNSPETILFNKSIQLYGLNFARDINTDYFLLCEGYMDVITLHQAGFHQAVASLGTALTIGQAYLLRRYTTHVLLCYDSDDAGTKAAARATSILNQVGIFSKQINLFPYKDPDEFIKNLGKNVFQERIDQTK